MKERGDLMNEDFEPEVNEILNKKLKKIIREGREGTGEVKGGKIYHLNRGNILDFLNSFKVAVIDFWAEWCPPCFLISPIIEEMARDYPDVGFGKLNYDEGQDIAYSLGVMNLPTILMFKHGKPVDGVIGAVPRYVIESKLRRLL
jgi:thioredoxin 1